MARRAAYALCAVVWLTGCSGRPHVVTPPSEVDPVRPHRVHVVSHGWHTGLVVPGTVLNEAVPALRERFGTPAYYEVGWGDKGFYQAQEITTGLTLQAMFWSEGAVLHIVAMNRPPAQYFAGEPLVDTCLSAAELASLQHFLQASFDTGAGTAPVALKRGIYGDSQFYDGSGRYYLFNTCNKWTAKALRSAGLEIAPMFKLTAGSVMEALAIGRHMCEQAH